LWSKWVNTPKTFAKDHGTKNQPGCYYDEGHGVLFNKNTAFSGTYNEDKDRPICQIKPDGKNCNCGNRVQQWATGKDTVKLCRAACKSNKKCKSFGLWLEGSNSAGYCALFDKACTGKCPAPTNTKGGWFNRVFNMRSERYVDGIKGASGSSDCPAHYVAVQNEVECRKIAQGLCLSDNPKECELWSKWVNTPKVFAKDHGNRNQPGCYYDEGHGVLFNKNTAFSGTHNEKTDRPICKIKPFGVNCNCGKRLEEFPTGKASVELCGGACAANRTCKSFGLWTDASNSAGYCALFDQTCTGKCPQPTNTKLGYFNRVFNYERKSFQKLVRS